MHPKSLHQDYVQDQVDRLRCEGLGDAEIYRILRHNGVNADSIRIAMGYRVTKSRRNLLTGVLAGGRRRDEAAAGASG